MKKLNRFGVILGLLAGAGVMTYVPAALSQEAESGPAPEMMDNIDISMQHGPSLPPLGMHPDAFQGVASMVADPDEIVAMHPGGDLMLIRAGVHGKFTDDQLEQMYKVKSDFIDRAGIKFAELKLQQRALHNLITQPDFEKGKAQSIQSKINGLRDELANLRLDQQMGLLNCLTADQRKELRRSYVKHMDFGMMGMGPGMHGAAHRACGPGGRGGHRFGGFGGHHWEGAEGAEHGHHEHHEHHEHQDGSSPSSSSEKG